MKLFIANVAFSITEAELKQMFTQFGQVGSIKLITDPETGKRKGFGFIEMPVRDQALRAVAGLHDKMVNGRKLSVKVAVDKETGQKSSYQPDRSTRRNITDSNGDVDGNRW